MIAGRYTREREIGRGGMGAVWLGRDEVLGRPVAIKSVGLAPGGDSHDHARAEREAKIAARLSHPHIVGVFDLVLDDGQQWLVMEYVEGTTLSELVRTNGPLSPDDAAPVIAQAASALATAHANGVVHRDVKPSNILVREDGHVKLTDFGIARGVSDPALTQTGLVTGSPAYLAPEVASGQWATPACDVWSLGATLFHALTGSPPYDATDNVLGALYRIVNDPPPRTDLAGRLAPLLEGTMTASTDDRWTMEQVVDFLEGRAAPTRTLSAATAPATAPAPAAAPATAPLRPEQGAAALAPAPPPASPPASPGASPTGHRRRSGLPIVISAAVALLVLAVVALVLQDDPQDDLADAPLTSPSPSASATPSEEPEEPDETPTSPPEPTKRELRDFVDSYLTLATTEPDRAFEMLTPAFQRQSTRYEEFWGTVSNPRLVDFDADTSALTVSYTYRYQRQGAGRQEDRVQLQLVASDDGFLIAGEA